MATHQRRGEGEVHGAPIGKDRASNVPASAYENPRRFSASAKCEIAGVL
jgi:hypothetical protein